MNFLANENFPLASVRILRGSGYGLKAVAEDFPGADDRKVLRCANEENRVILTFDRDYGELVYKYNLFVPAGIAYFRFDPSTPEEPAEILLTLIDRNKLLLAGRFTVIERDNIRQRILK